MKRLTALLTALWLGMQTGFYAASLVLFNQLDKETAGHIAGILFNIANWVGLVAWILAWLMCRNSQPSWHDNGTNPAKRWIGLLLFLLALTQFFINPAIHALKVGQEHFLVTIFGGTFGAWHGTSYILYMIISVIGLGLCIHLLRFNSPEYR